MSFNYITLDSLQLSPIGTRNWVDVISLQDSASNMLSPYATAVFQHECYSLSGQSFTMLQIGNHVS